MSHESASVASDFRVHTRMCERYSRRESSVASCRSADPGGAWSRLSSVSVSRLVSTSASAERQWWRSCAVDAIGLGALVPLPRRPPAAASTPSTLLLRALDRLESAPSSAVAASSSSRLIGSRRSTTDAWAAPLPAESSSPNFES